MEIPEKVTRVLFAQIYNELRQYDVKVDKLRRELHKHDAKLRKITETEKELYRSSMTLEKKKEHRTKYDNYMKLKIHYLHLFRYKLCNNPVTLLMRDARKLVSKTTYTEDHRIFLEKYKENRTYREDLDVLFKRFGVE